MTNELDGPWYEERNPITLAPRIDIPVYLQIDQGRGWTMDGTIELFHALKGPKKLDIGPYPPMQSRPFVEEHDTMFRWYDYWIKGIDNGVMDEPAVAVFVCGTPVPAGVAVHRSPRGERVGGAGRFGVPPPPRPPVVTLLPAQSHAPPATRRSGRPRRGKRAAAAATGS